MIEDEVAKITFLVEDEDYVVLRGDGKLFWRGEEVEAKTNLYPALKSFIDNTEKRIHTKSDLKREKITPETHPDLYDLDGGVLKDWNFKSYIQNNFRLPILIIPSKAKGFIIGDVDICFSLQLDFDSCEVMELSTAKPYVNLHENGS